MAVLLPWGPTCFHCHRGPLRVLRPLHSAEKSGRKARPGGVRGGSLGDLATYVVTSIQLGVVYGNYLEYLSIFALTQIPLAIAEGLLTVVVFNVLEKYAKEDLRALAVL